MKNRKNKYLVESARITDAYFNMYAKRVDEDAYSIGNTIGNIGYKAKQFVGNAIKGGVEFGKGIKDGFNGYGKKSDSNKKAIGVSWKNNYDSNKKAIGVSWKNNYENDPNYISDSNKKAIGVSWKNNYENDPNYIRINRRVYLPDGSERGSGGDYVRRQPGEVGISKTIHHKIYDDGSEAGWTVYKDKNGQKITEPENNNANGIINQVTKTTDKEIEYPENGDIEYTGEEEDYLTGKTNVRPKTLAPNAREEYRKTFESCNGKKNGKKVNEVADGKLHADPVDIYTIQISRVLDNGDQEGIDEIKYAKTYYDIHDAVEDAKKAYSEYANDGEEIVVDIIAGEQEHESGDIHEEPYVILTVKGGKLLDVSGKEVDTTEEEFIGNIDGTNESYEDNEEIDYGDDKSVYAEDYADDKLKNAISVIKKICAKYGAKVTDVSEGDKTHALIFIKIKDPNKTLGVGFDMNRIMGAGYEIERECKKYGINAFFASAYGNNVKFYLNKGYPIVDSDDKE